MVLEKKGCSNIESLLCIGVPPFCPIGEDAAEGGEVAGESY